MGHNRLNNLVFRSKGQDVIIWPQAKIVAPERISVGNSVIIDDFVFLVGGADTRIGSFVHIASFSSITGGGEFVMADFSALSSGVRVFTGNEDYTGGCMTNPTVPAPYRIAIRSFVTIHKHAIIGANTVILPGVTIGEGASIGANSLITRDCAPWMVYVGTPARPVKPRPNGRIKELEARLKRELYTAEGCYVPKAARPETRHQKP